MTPNNVSVNSHDVTPILNNRLFPVLTTFVLTILVALVTNCNSSIKQAERRVENAYGDLRHPPHAVLVERVSDIGGGSDPKCWTAFTTALYGTSQDYEDVLTFYMLNLSAQGWQTTGTPGRFQLSDGVSLQILSEKDVWASLAIPYETRQKSQEQFNTIFFLTIAYSDPANRAYCRQH
jgi:hypothetical protein